MDRRHKVCPPETKRHRNPALPLNAGRLPPTFLLPPPLRASSQCPPKDQAPRLGDLALNRLLPPPAWALPLAPPHITAPAGLHHTHAPWSCFWLRPLCLY